MTNVLIFHLEIVMAVYCIGVLGCVMRKAAFCICKNKVQICCTVAAQLISAFVFAT